METKFKKIKSFYVSRAKKVGNKINHWILKSIIKTAILKYGKSGTCLKQACQNGCNLEGLS